MTTFLRVKCWPDIRIDVDNDSDDEQAAKSAGWGLDSFLGAGQALAEGTAASAARVSAIVATGTARAPVAGYGASLIEQDDRTTGSEAEGGAKASSGTTTKLPVAGFQFNMIQPLTSAGGREVPLPWADNKGTVVFRAKIPVAKRDPALPKTIPDKAGMCLIGEKELPLQDLLKQAENDAGDEERHCVELETPEDEENSPDRGFGADPMQLDLTVRPGCLLHVLRACIIAHRTSCSHLCCRLVHCSSFVAVECKGACQPRREGGCCCRRKGKRARGSLAQAE